MRWLALALVMFSCGGEEETPPPEPDETPSTPQGSFHPEDDLYDEEGNLQASDEVLAGLPLPLGLTLERQVDRRHIYSSRIPIEKIVGFFGPKLFTGNVTRIGDGAVYRGATLVGVENAPRFTVSVIAAGTQTRVEIEELPPVPETPPTPQEMEQRWQEMQKRLD
ncbi:MAG: hypothetical protein AAGE52_41550 [Myxococcota bacterium]